MCTKTSPNPMSLDPNLLSALVDAVKEGGEVGVEALATMLCLFQEEDARKNVPAEIDLISLLTTIIKNGMGEKDNAQVIGR